jgi:hypothetical protein
MDKYTLFGLFQGIESNNTPKWNLEAVCELLAFFCIFKIPNCKEHLIAFHKETTSTKMPRQSVSILLLSFLIIDR